MADHYCQDCGQVTYECVCYEGQCCLCGEDLTREELAAGPDECFDCYVSRHD